LKVVWTRLAVDRAYEQARYIAEDKPEAALRWLDGAFKATDRLESFPRSGRVVREVGSENLREVIYRSHRIIYRIEKNAVLILTLRGAAQRLDLKELDGSKPG
jgi:plasmid stabilization system protein ParE